MDFYQVDQKKGSSNSLICEILDFNCAYYLNKLV